MNGLREKFRNKKGFTLIEMLIVVAIIAILIAVSIPMIANSLEKTRHATDAANERSAKAEMVVQYLAEGDAAIYEGGVKKDDAKVAVGTTYYYDAANGRLDTKSDSITPYGQCEHGKHTGTGTGEGIIQLTIDADGQVTVSWGGTGTTLCGTAKDVKHS